jgi:hypothetical protein
MKTWSNSDPRRDLQFWTIGKNQYPCPSKTSDDSAVLLWEYVILLRVLVESALPLSGIFFAAMGMSLVRCEYLQDRSIWTAPILALLALVLYSFLTLGVKIFLTGYGGRLANATVNRPSHGLSRTRRTSGWPLRMIIWHSALSRFPPIKRIIYQLCVHFCEGGRRVKRKSRRIGALRAGCSERGTAIL